MTVQAHQEDKFTFVQGLNTEAGFFGFPTNAWKDGTNMVPSINGSIRKRVAVDLELNYTTHSALTSIHKDAFSFTVAVWQAVGGNGDLNFIIAQVGSTLYFYKDTSISTSTTQYPFTVTLGDFKASGYAGSTADFPISITSANGRCIVTSKGIDPILLEYDATTNELTATRITIKIRDFKGVDDGLAVQTKPESLSTLHRYNLQNQGWSFSLITTYYNTSGDNRYPSNAQSWVYGKNATDDFSAVLLDKQDFGTSPAPRGRYILDAFDEDRSGASGIGGIARVRETTRPSTCAFYAGRAWYAGVGGTRLLSNVYFSQVAVDSDNYGKCFQSADPTSEVLSDLVDSDGGVIAIQDCGEIVSLVTSGTGVLVLATNGVWQIVGTSQGGFTATGYEVNKLSSYGCISAGSVVLVNDSVFYWSYSAICQIAANNLGGFSVSPITDTSIKTLYIDIPTVAKKYTASAFNTSSKVIYWMYNDGMQTDIEFPYRKTRVLALDTRLGAFYVLDIPETNSLPSVVWLTTTKESIDTQADLQVITSDASTVIADSDDVIATLEVGFASERQFKFLTVTPEGGITFADFLTQEVAPAKFKDWFSYDDVGSGYEAYVLTGLTFGGNGPTKYKQALYVSTFMEKTEIGINPDFTAINPSSCLIQGRWDFSDSAVSNKWSVQQQIYKRHRVFAPAAPGEFDDGYSLITAKTKIRGRGRSLQLMFSTEEEADAVLLGWSVLGYGATNV